MTAASVSRTYVIAVVVSGGFGIAASIALLVAQPPASDFYYLAALTAISGLLPVKVPKVSANISVAETFVYAGTLLLGAASGVLLVVLDALIIWIRLWVKDRRVNVGRLLFSLSASALALAAAAFLLFALIDVPPLGSLALAGRPNIWRFAGALVVFSTTYFLLNTWLVAVAIALETRARAATIWRGNFSRLAPNYLASASLAMLLVYQNLAVNLAFLIVIVPLVVVMFLTYRGAALQIEEAERHLDQMNRTFLQTIEAFAIAIDAKDQGTHGHIRRVQRYTMEMAKVMGIDNPRLLDALRAAALLHDTGKLAVPEYILNKPGRLTPAEYERMKMHAAIGADILKSIDFPYPIEPIVRHHHEAWDGTGYPAGLKGAEIPIGARILAVVDCYDAIRSDRPYRKRMRRPEAEAVIRERSGTMYDPYVVETFLENLDRLEAMDSADDEPVTTPAIEAIAATFRDQQAHRAAADRAVAGVRAHAAAVLLSYMAPRCFARAMAVYIRDAWTDEVIAESTAGAGSERMRGLRLEPGGGISGWACSNQKAAVNSDAALDLGPLACTDQGQLRFALAVPVIIGADCACVVTMYGAERFTEGDRERLDTAARLLWSGLRPAAIPPMPIAS